MADDGVPPMKEKDCRKDNEGNDGEAGDSSMGDEKPDCEINEEAAVSRTDHEKDESRTESLTAERTPGEQTEPRESERRRELDQPADPETEPASAEAAVTEDKDGSDVTNKPQRESHDESFWYKLCEQYRDLREQNPDKNISQRAFLKSDQVVEVSGEPKDCRSFSRYWKRFEMGDLNPNGTKKRRAPLGGLPRIPGTGRSSRRRGLFSGSAGSSFAAQLMKKRKIMSESEKGETDGKLNSRPPPKLLPFRKQAEAAEPPPNKTTTASDDT